MLTFNLKKEWFDKIKNGEKTHEYRRVTPYWEKRMWKIIIGSTLKFKYNPEYDGHDTIYIPDNKIICFKCGYPKNTETNKILYAKVLSVFKDFDGNYSDLHINEPVYDIEFELIGG